MVFQLTTSRRGRLYNALTQDTILHLSTHDLTQRSTVFVRCPPSVYRLSTHDLTQRSTYLCKLPNQRNSLSTHDLTQRSTMPHQWHPDKNIFQLTTSRRGRLDRIGSCYRSRSFNSRPHAEVDINISHILCKISILFLIFFTKTTLNKAQKYEYYFIFAKINC